MPSYRRPPITEAVIEVRFATSIERRDIERIEAGLKSAYPTSEELFQVSAKVGAADSYKETFESKKLTSRDGASVLLIRTNAIATVRLAPYEGWESFIDVAKSNWDRLVKAVGTREVTRIGVRYLNRLDIPSSPKGMIKIEDYLLFCPTVPTSLDTGLTQFGTNAVIPRDGFGIILNSGSVPSPLVNHQSYVLDLDLFVDGPNLPKHDKGLWETIEGLRREKNSVFEVCITDKARELFQ